MVNEIFKNMNNPVYVLEQPKFSICSVVLVDTRLLPLTEGAHSNLDLLRAFSDVFFVFSEEFGIDNIDLEKFTSLYGGIAWTKGHLVGSTMFGALEYSVEIFKEHKIFLITDTNRLSEAVVDSEKIYNLALSDVFSPILKISRLSPDELYEIYRTEEEEKEWYRCFMYSRSPKLKTRLNSLYKSDSNIFFFKIGIIKQLVNYLKDKKFKDYVETFTEDDMSYLFASYIKYLGIENINSSLENVNYGGKTV